MKLQGAPGNLQPYLPHIIPPVGKMNHIPVNPEAYVFFAQQTPFTRRGVGGCRGTKCNQERKAKQEGDKGPFHKYGFRVFLTVKAERRLMAGPKKSARKWRLNPFIRKPYLAVGQRYD
jgi:hypothetical protein